MIKWIKLHWKAFKVDVKYYWRKLRGRCIQCNGLLGHTDAHNYRYRPNDCLHCKVNKNVCHWCGKRFNFALMYGMRVSK